MKNHGTTPMSVKDFKEMVGAVVRQLPTDMDSTTAEGWVQNQEALKKALRKVLLPPKDEVVDLTFTVTVDRFRTVAEAVKAGNYDRANANIHDQSFPFTRSGVKEETEIILLHFGKAMTLEQVLVEMEKRGLRSADIMEILSIGEQKPELQRQFTIVELGSPWQYPFGDKGVVCLNGRGPERELNLLQHEGDWLAVWRFACVRK